jgi:para-nitrobenzyl esterase
MKQIRVGGGLLRAPVPAAAWTGVKDATAFGQACLQPPKPPQTPEEARLSDAMLNYWVSFARSGVPVAPGETAWPRFTARKRGYLDLDERPLARADLQPAAYHWADALVAQRRAEDKGWRLDIGFSTFPPLPQGRVDGAEAKPLPESR